MPKRIPKAVGSTKDKTIAAAVRKVADGDPMLSPSVTASLIRQVADSSVSAAVDRAGVAKGRLAELTDRELEVALGVGEGKSSNAEIAGALFMSVATVKAHVSRVLTKFDATNRVQIAMTVHDAGLTE